MDFKNEERVKNLGPVVGIIYSTIEPKNKKVLWYDETITAGCPIKYYNLTSNTWNLITQP